ncbi:hypothetical protein AAY473_021657, partial [Plecturocebus cupreus]
MVPATQEAGAGESLEPRSKRPQWARIVPLHCSLGDRETESQELLEPGMHRLQRAEITPLHSSLDNRARLCLNKKKKKKKKKKKEEVRRAVAHACNSSTLDYDNVDIISGKEAKAACLSPGISLNPRMPAVLECQAQGSPRTHHCNVEPYLRVEAVLATKEHLGESPARRLVAVEMMFGGVTEAWPLKWKISSKTHEPGYSDDTVASLNSCLQEPAK